MEVEFIPNVKTKLGEGPIWDQQTQRLYWVDIEEKRLYHHEPETKKTDLIQLSQKISAFALTSDQEAVIVVEDGFYFLDLMSGQLTPIQQVEKEKEDNRFNDGKCDAKGRFFAGSMSTAGKKEQGALYCLQLNLKVEEKLKPVGLSNGLAWSLDNQYLYFIDTPKQTVDQFDYDLESSAMSNQKQIIDFEKEEGVADGMTIDSEGMLWIAHYGGARVSRWNPNTGEKLSEIPLPALNITSCTFGGKNLNELYITSSIEGMKEDQFEKYPLSGRVMKVATTFTGTKAERFVSSHSS